MSFLQRFAQHLGLALAGMFVMVGRPSGFALAIEMSEGAQVITVAVQNELITPQVMYHDLRSLPKAKKDKPGDPRVEKPGRVTQPPATEQGGGLPAGPDPLLERQNEALTGILVAGLTPNFGGLSLTGVRPSDSGGAAGPNHHTQTITVAAALGSPPPSVSAGVLSQAAIGPETGEVVEYAISAPARELPGPVVAPPATFRPPRINPLANELDRGQRGTWNRASVPLDRLIGPPEGPGLQTPPVNLSFDGTGNPTACNGCTPPDTNGDVGPNHYVQMVNATKVAIFDKTGMLLTPAFNLGNLWPAGAICRSNAGDPVVLYDPLADRWLLSQFADPNHMCFAISQTADPLGSYHLYTFNVGSFPDYFKIGVWPNAYYLSANESSYTAYAFNRAKMLIGDPTANFVKFSGQNNFLLPADLDGPNAPAVGSPGLFYTFKDNSFHGGVDRIELFALVADFTTPANSTFTLTASLPTAPFTYTVCGFFNFNCVRQLGTNQRVDAVSEWPMHRFPYRNFGSHQTLLGNFTVGGGTGNVGAAIRWFELRDMGSGWTLFQEGTHDLGDGHDRFMGSIAMDGAGNIALGYSVSSDSLNPAIRYATRTPADPAGTFQAEAVLINGSGSQTGSNRWGDYSAMSVDPVDDCTFWYTNEYYPVNSTNQWKTRVGAFNVACTPTIGPDLVVTKTDSPDPVAAGANITYSIGVSNVGSAAATSVVLTDNTPATTTFQSVSAPAGWTCVTPPVGGTGAVTCSKATHAAGASQTLTLVVRVNPGTTGGTVLTNTVSVTEAEPDPTPGNNSASATTTVAGGATGPDLVVTKTDSPDPVAAGANITYSIGVSNVGSAAATNVVLTDTTPANTTFQLVSGAVWRCTNPAVGGTGLIRCTLPTLGAGAAAPLTLVVRVNPGTTGGTVVSNTASVSANQVDPTPSNNSATATTTVTGGGGGPTVSIADAQLIESRANMIFTLTLSAPSAQTVTVTAATANNTAAAGSDYLAKTGPVTFMPGQTTQTFAVAVISDTLVEGNETFFVNLSNAINATVADGQAVGTIIDND